MTPSRGHGRTESPRFAPAARAWWSPARQPERALGEQGPQELRRAGRDRHRPGVEVSLLPRRTAERPVGPEERHRELAGALLDLAAEELLERGFGRRVGSVVQPRQDAERVRGEDLGLDVSLRDVLPEGRDAAAAVEVGERLGRVLQADLELEGPQRAAL